MWRKWRHPTLLKLSNFAYFFNLESLEENKI